MISAIAGTIEFKEVIYMCIYIYNKIDIRVLYIYIYKY